MKFRAFKINLFFRNRAIESFRNNRNRQQRVYKVIMFMLFLNEQLYRLLTFVEKPLY